jgi:hypothetical protein
LSITIRVDGSHDYEVIGASTMPRHWIYDENSDLVAKSGMIDFKGWAKEGHKDRTPWGDEDSPAIITAVESELERQLSVQIMQDGKKPKFRKLETGEDLVTQGEPGAELFLLLDGVLTVLVDGEEVAEVGPGSILGERAGIEGGIRTSTLRARTPVRVAIAHLSDLQSDVLEDLSTHHRREEAVTAAQET